MRANYLTLILERENVHSLKLAHLHTCDLDRVVSTDILIQIVICGSNAKEHKYGFLATEVIMREQTIHS